MLSIGKPGNRSKTSDGALVVEALESRFLFSALPLINVNNVRVKEAPAGAMATFTVRLSKKATDVVSVDYQTADGSASSAGGNYVPVSGTLVFALGERIKTISVPIEDDLIDEPNRVFSLQLTNAAGAQIGKAAGQCTIIDNDAPPTVSINDAAAPASDGVMAFEVALSGASGFPVLVHYATAATRPHASAVAGVDYSSRHGVIVLTPGEVSDIISVLIITAKAKANTNFELLLSEPTHCRLSKRVGMGTITDAVNPNVDPSASALDSIVGKSFVATITGGSGSFAASGEFTFSASSVANTYTITGSGGIPDSTGTYVYSRANQAGAILALSDSSMGDVFSSQFTFTGDGIGTYVIHSASLDSFQSGTFEFL